MAPALAHARASDRDQPMSLDSSTSDCNLTDENSKCVFSGDVVIIQAPWRSAPTAPRSSAATARSTKVVLTGKQATMKQQMDDGSMMNARADRIVYETRKDILTLSGNFTIESPRGSNSGQKMVYNMGTGQMQSGGDGTRVRTVIQPKKTAGSGT
ncbi:lipopolysaccharide transport periplasmic protein LptA [Pseudoxanthomonas sp. NC8]|nr:lipopolysaccharide transport periplasmic protein LptA [Pseudoxanthomonas sp. NC8]